MCWKPSGRSKFCYRCRERKQNAGAIVSQNKKKLRKLLEWNTLTPEWLDKFMVYSTNIITYWKVVMEYNEKDTARTFEKILRFSTLCCWIVSTMFIAEILITVL